MKTFVIKTFGCKVNQYESQNIREQLLSRGFRDVSGKKTDNPDYCVVNTCSVTGRAQAKGRNCFNKFKKMFPSAAVVVTGCTVDYEPDVFKGKADILVSNKNKEFLAEKISGGNNVLNCSGITKFDRHTRGFIKVQDGCNEFCSYCILPLIRARSRSRDVKDILKEISRLIENGYREIVVTGIHLGDFGKDKGQNDALIVLLEELEKNQGLLRIRLSSLEPQDITDALIAQIAKSAKICRHLHVPIQSGDDVILKSMNRKYDYLEYKTLIDKIRFAIPDINFTTDMIVGFPGETEKCFENSYRAVEDLMFSKVHIFRFSLRKQTMAVNISGTVSNDVIKRRTKILEDISRRVSFKLKQELVGSVHDVLIEKNGKESAGYTSGYLPVRISRNMPVNIIARVKIADVVDNCLVGEVV